ncbi:MAG: hypothetical protein AB7S93_08135 [Xanthobacteraceae bacterium]
MAGLVGMAVLATAAPALAQSNLDAGKTPAQIFANTCNACHRSPREIKRTTAAFMREHYTTGVQEAAAMATYLASMGTDPKAVQQRRKPVLGAGKEPPPSEKPSGEAQAELNGAKNGLNTGSRRPSESFEATSSLAASFMAEEPPAPPSAPAVVPASSAFEE